MQLNDEDIDRIIEMAVYILCILLLSFLVQFKHFFAISARRWHSRFYLFHSDFLLARMCVFIVDVRELTQMLTLNKLINISESQKFWFIG